MKPKPISVNLNVHTSKPLPEAKVMAEAVESALYDAIADRPELVTRDDVIAECKRILSTMTDSGQLPRYEIRVTDDAVEVWDLMPSHVRLDVTINVDGTVTNNLKGD